MLSPYGLPLRFSFTLVFFDIIVTMIDVRRPLHVSDGGDADVATDHDPEIDWNQVVLIMYSKDRLVTQLSGPEVV